MTLKVESRDKRGFVKQVSYNEGETVYVAGRDIEDAQRRRGDHRFYGDVEGDSPAEAWDKIGYFEREDSGDEFEVFRITTEVRITKVEPPYTKIIPGP
ncbi:hypothetical protein [Streptomyces sp. NPDC006355]|uniref:hypothetical protein n=1 Tax=Streptomyces sp. NPDC006355 TaxID=3156758 RepID=UPI0033A17765